MTAEIIKLIIYRLFLMEIVIWLIWFVLYYEFYIKKQFKKK